jgi:hypothetical protein
MCGYANILSERKGEHSKAAALHRLALQTESTHVPALVGLASAMMEMPDGDAAKASTLYR